VHGSLRAAVEGAPPGSTIVVPPGEHPALLDIGKDIDIEGAGPASTTLLAEPRQPIVHVSAPCRLRISRLTLRGGSVSWGGAIRVSSPAGVLLEDCVVERNFGHKGGGAVHAVAGDLTVRRTVLRRNGGALGGAVLAEGHARVIFEDAVLEENEADAGGGIFARDAARIRLRRTFLRLNRAKKGASAIEARGAAAAAPLIEVVGGGISGPAPAVLLEALGRGAPVFLRARGAALPAEARGEPGFCDDGGNRFA
jgi:hypothetical protein